MSILINNSSERVIPLLSDKYTCCVTSPPYNIGKFYGNGYDDTKSKELYLAGIESVFSKLSDIMEDNGLVFLNIGEDKKDYLKHTGVLLRVTKYFKHLQTIIWVKSFTDEENITHGQYSPTGWNSKFAGCFEYIYILSKDPNTKFDKRSIGVPYTDKSNMQRWKGAENNDLKAIGDVWYIPYETTGHTRKKEHPAPYPLELPKRCIAISPPGLVVDPYAGICTTGAAAQTLHRGYTMIDQNREFLQTGKDIFELDAEIVGGFK